MFATLIFLASITKWIRYVKYYDWYWYPHSCHRGKFAAVEESASISETIFALSLCIPPIATGTEFHLSKSCAQLKNFCLKLSTRLLMLMNCL